MYDKSENAEVANETAAIIKDYIIQQRFTFEPWRGVYPYDFAVVEMLPSSYRHVTAQSYKHYCSEITESKI